jgi:hypothetical protein
MSHDPIHDWLDMAFRKLGGDKNAYSDYKEHQSFERGLRQAERARRQGYSADDDGLGNLPQFHISASDPSGSSFAGGSPVLPGVSSRPYATPFGAQLSSGGIDFGKIAAGFARRHKFGGPFSQRPVNSYGQGGSCGAPSMSGGPNPYGQPGGPNMSGGLSPYGSRAGSLRSGSRNPYGGSGSPPPQYSISSARSQAGSLRNGGFPGQGQRLIGGPRSSGSRSNASSAASNAHSLRRQGSGMTQGSFNQSLVPYGQNRAGSGLRPRSRSDAAHSGGRVPTAQAPLGDMTRSYLEGMVPNSEANSFRRRHRWRAG